MNTKEIEIKNPTRSRKWGWGYSYTPTGNGTEINVPTRPDYVGTLHQIQRAIETDPVLASNRSAYMAEAWFYVGKRIVATYMYDMTEPGTDSDDNPDGFFDNATYDWAWFVGFPSMNEIELAVSIDNTIKIRTLL
jgi:hypothetical protein